MLAAVLAVAGAATLQGCRREPERDFTDKEIILLSDQELDRLIGAPLKPADRDAIQRERGRRTERRLARARRELELELSRRFGAGTPASVTAAAMTDEQLGLLLENADALGLDEEKRAAIRQELAWRSEGR
ncbi:MAG: hypothetical protein L0027_05265 [Candidatus Rokubacteria bacterium]|nr:hypothetical protein [Candidatus Rokubacteria bacterium]